MKKIQDARDLKIIITILFLISTLIACSSSLNENKAAGLQGTVAAQNTIIAHLSTLVAKQEQTNQSQWENIGHLYTQMPYALGIITPLPPGVTLTRTPYSLTDQAPAMSVTRTPTATSDTD